MAIKWLRATLSFSFHDFNKLIMEIKYDSHTPQPYIYTIPKVTLNFNVKTTESDVILNLWKVYRTDDMPLEPEEWFVRDHKYTYNQLFIPIGQWTRDGIVNAIIRDKYRIDEMEAITNNMAAITAVFMQTLVSDGIIAATKYLKESINDDNTKRFKEMQEWRAMAKKVASEIIKE